MNNCQGGLAVDELFRKAFTISVGSFDVRELLLRLAYANASVCQAVHVDGPDYETASIKVPYFNAVHDSIVRVRAHVLPERLHAISSSFWCCFGQSTPPRGLHLASIAQWTTVAIRGFTRFAKNAGRQSGQSQSALCRRAQQATQSEAVRMCTFRRLDSPGPPLPSTTLHHFGACEPSVPESTTMRERPILFNGAVARVETT